MLLSSATETFQISREIVQDQGTLQRMVKLFNTVSIADTKGIFTDELHLAATGKTYREKASQAKLGWFDLR